MEQKDLNRAEDMNQAQRGRYIIDMLHRIVVHHVLWFKEVEHQLGMKKALEILDQTYPNTINHQLKRLSRELGFELDDSGVPGLISEMPEDRQISLMDAIAKNWLANDGVWFLAVEGSHGMNDAKRCNDSCWTRYSPFEAWAIKRFLGLPEHPGIEGLKKALNFRMYARLNVQTTIEEGENCIQFQMNECRVQSARKRKGLDDYPCKSVGLVEYGYFAEAIDSRITTECIGCPPDPHPEEWVCAWRFRLEEK